MLRKNVSQILVIIDFLSGEIAGKTSLVRKNFIGNTHICRIKGCGGAGCPPPPPIIFERLKLPQTNYISSEREFIGESESSKILGKYFGFAIL